MNYYSSSHYGMSIQMVEGTSFHKLEELMVTKIYDYAHTRGYNAYKGKNWSALVVKPFKYPCCRRKDSWMHTCFQPSLLTV